jgi:hypothetical protein
MILYPTDEGYIPTPEALVEVFDGLTSEDRLEFMGRYLLTAQTATRCVSEQHSTILFELGESDRAAATIARERDRARDLAAALVEDGS